MKDNYDLTMITSEGCPHCAEAKELLKDKIESGRIRILDVSKDNDALELAKKYNVEAVPTVIVNDKITNIGEACDLKRDLSGVICKNKEVDF